MYRRRYAAKHVHSPESDFAHSQIAALRDKLSRGETSYLVGIGPAGHNSGLALVEASAKTGLRLIANDEEERFSGVKHAADYPEQSVAMLRSQLEEHGLSYRDLHAILTTWDYISVVPVAMRAVVEHLPYSLGLARRACMPKWDFHCNGEVCRAAPARLAQQLGAPAPLPLICQHHHDNHAAMSYALSPFARDGKAVLVTVLDGFGDEGAISVYLAENGRLRPLRKNYSFIDSLGIFYSIISSTQGGWTTLSSEGRYMGAVAWGDGDRLTNRYYRRLREIFHFGAEGAVTVNRTFVNWHNRGEQQPYGRPMCELLGDPIPLEKMWNPDAVLRVDDIQHSEITRERCDLAAATQLVFEDALFHIVDHFLRATGCERLVLTGGTALNCLGNMRLLERYDEAWYGRNLGRKARLHLWVPPVPGDAGAPIGAAYHFGLLAGAAPGEPLQHAFYCGRGFSSTEMQRALEGHPEVAAERLGDVRRPGMLESLADLAASIVSQDGVLGLFQGPAETGPRALGHRSILANPCNPDSMATINQRVKYRELVRPLAPMVTREAAEKFFDLSPGASADDYNAYNYMVLTAPARSLAYARIPAVVHKDGTARLQIVRREHDPFTHAYLRAMGVHAGVEASVNTSLNVGSPIVQTPAQALGALERARGMSGLLLISDEGEAYLAWHNVDAPPKDRGRQLQGWIANWRERTRKSVSVPAQTA
ncbi:MAG: carbamoyltransferase C-terminal domain-containing protein [Planctomycetaceae bacterium]